MAEVHGKNHICDACGYTIFLERTPAFSDKPTEYVDPPCYWTHSSEFGDMCPDCTRRFSRFVVSMFGLEKVPEKWRTF